MTTSAQTFRWRLIEVLGERTQSAFAAEIGIEQTTLSRWLTGETTPSRRMALRLIRMYPELRAPLMHALLGEDVA